MALKAVVTDLDGVEEAFRDHYRQEGDIHVLQIEDFGTHPGARLLKGTADKKAAEAQDLAKRVEAAEARLEGLPDDFTAADFEDLQRRAEGKDAPKAEEQVTRVREQLERKHQRDISERDALIKEYQERERRTAIEGGLSKAMDEAGIGGKHKPKLLPYLERLAAIKTEVVDGHLNVSVDTDMGPVSLSRFVSDWAASEDGRDYVPKPTGGNAPGGNGQRFAENPWDTQGGKVKPNLTKQQEFIAANPEKARQMAQAAGVQPNW